MATLNARTWAIPGIAGQYTAHQLWNPPDSGANITLRTINFDYAQDASAQVIMMSTPLDHSILDAGAGNEAGINGSHQNGTVARLRYYQGPTLPQGGQLATMHLRAFDPREWRGLDGFVITPGHGVTVRFHTAGITAYLAFMWEE